MTVILDFEGRAEVQTEVINLIIRRAHRIFWKQLTLFIIYSMIEYKTHICLGMS